MTSGVPIVRQIAWASVIPQLALGALLVTAAYRAGIRSFVVAGSGAYLLLSFCLRPWLAREHFGGVTCLRKEMFEQARQHFERSYEFFNRRRFLDDWRFITMLSSSRLSYREMALLNIAVCHALAGDRVKAREDYERVLREFPHSDMATTALRMVDAKEDGMETPDAPPVGLEG